MIDGEGRIGSEFNQVGGFDLSFSHSWPEASVLQSNRATAAINFVVSISTPGEMMAAKPILENDLDQISGLPDSLLFFLANLRLEALAMKIAAKGEAGYRWYLKRFRRKDIAIYRRQPRDSKTRTWR